MARGRMILRKTGLNDALVKLADVAGPWAVVCHHRLLAFQDRNGNTRVDGSFLKSSLFPLQKRLSAATLEGFARSMEAVGLIRTYESNGLLYANFPTFNYCQVGLNYNKEKDEHPLSPWQSPGDFQKKSGKEPEKGRTQSELESESEEEIKKPPTPLKGEPDLAFDWPQIYEQVQKDFTKLHRDFPGIPALKSLNAPRKRMVEHRWREPGFDWPLILKTVRSSPFLRGEGEARQGSCKPFAFNFDFVFARTSRWLEILEGKYGLPAPERRPESLQENEPSAHMLALEARLETEAQARLNDPANIKRGERFLKELDRFKKSSARRKQTEEAVHIAEVLASIAESSPGINGEKP